MAWFGNLPDISKLSQLSEQLGSSLGTSLGDAIQKAKDEVEKSVDIALHADPSKDSGPGAAAAAESDSALASQPASSSQPEAASAAADQATAQPASSSDLWQSQWMNIQSLSASVTNKLTQALPANALVPTTSDTSRAAPDDSRDPSSSQASNDYNNTEPHLHSSPSKGPAAPAEAATNLAVASYPPASPLADPLTPRSPSRFFFKQTTPGSLNGLSPISTDHHTLTSCTTSHPATPTRIPLPATPTTPAQPSSPAPQPGTEPTTHPASHAAVPQAPLPPLPPTTHAREHSQPPQQQNGTAPSPQPTSQAGPPAHEPAPAPQLDDDLEDPAWLADPASTADLEAMSMEELREAVGQLRSELKAREGQLVRQAHQMSSIQQVMAQLTEKNEQLVLKASKISESDFEELRAEFEQRLASADRRATAAAQAREEMRRECERLNAALKDRDDTINQVMREGEVLSKKQVDLETKLKQLRSALKDSESERERLSARLTATQEEAEGTKRMLARLERELQAAREQAAADLAAQRQQWEGLLNKARAAQVEAEERGREAGKEGTVRRVREAESRAEALEETVAELKDALERQRQAATLREEMLQQDMHDLERRCQAAESRHSELMSKLPEATRPLLKQIEAMQAASAAQMDAWRAAEGTLQQRIADAEARAAAASERELLANDRQQILLNKVQALEASLAASRSEVKRLGLQVEAAGGRASEAEEVAATAQQQCEMLQLRVQGLLTELQQVEKLARDELDAERAGRKAAEADAAAAKKEAERRAAEAKVEAERRREGGLLVDGAPALAGPGYRWVLMKEEEAHNRRPGGNSSGAEPSSPLSPVSRTGGISRLGSGPANGLPPQNSGLPLTTEMETLRAALRARNMEVAAMEGQLREVEAQRDRLAEELVAASTVSDAASTAIRETEGLRAKVAALQAKLAAATELIGERDETLEELKADLVDIKAMYKEQIEYMVQQLAAVSSSSSSSAGRGGASGGEANGDVAADPPLPVSRGAG